MTVWRGLMPRLLLLVLVVLSAAGCQVVDKDRVQKSQTDTLPWNGRAGWEDQTLGVPY